jgi:hypothetical protein
MATDLATAIALGQLGQAGQSERTRRSLAERLTAGATTGRPVYSLGAALAQGLTGALGGYMAADADQREQTARNNAIAEALRGQDERQRAQMDAVIGVTQGNPVPEGQMGPARPASTGPAREDALALLSVTNPAARAQLDLDRDRTQRAAQERLVAGQRATQLEVARIQAGTRNQPQLPAGFRMRPDGTAERIPGLPEETGFQGTGMDQQAANVLLRVGPQIRQSYGYRHIVLLSSLSVPSWPAPVLHSVGVQWWRRSDIAKSYFVFAGNFPANAFHIYVANMVDFFKFATD